MEIALFGKLDVGSRSPHIRVRILSHSHEDQVFSVPCRHADLWLMSCDEVFLARSIRAANEPAAIS